MATPTVNEFRLAQLLADHLDDTPCRLDHHGGCQAHGFLDLEPGQRCPNAEARDLLQELGIDWSRGVPGQPILKRIRLL